jgi:hypothetical protein
MSHISQLAQKEVETLRGEGIALTFAECIWLNELGLAVEEPDGETCHGERGAPVKAGNVVLHPWTLASHDWFFRVAQKHYDTLDGVSLALAFALAHGTTPHVFAGLVARQDIYTKVNAWKLSVTATIPELREAAYRVRPEVNIPHDTSDMNADKRGVPWDTVICDLVAGTGLDEAYWRARPKSTLHDYWYAVQQQHAAGMMQDDERDRVRRTNLALLQAVEAIRRSRKPASDDTPIDERTAVERAAEILRVG